MGQIINSGILEPSLRAVWTSCERRFCKEEIHQTMKLTPVFSSLIFQLRSQSLPVLLERQGHLHQVVEKCEFEERSQLKHPHSLLQDSSCSKYPQETFDPNNAKR